MIDQGCNITAWTELNENWYNWLVGEIQSSHLLRGWKLYHDGLGVAIMRGPGIETKDNPVAVKVYDDAMLSEDPACRDRLAWRTIFCGEFHLTSQSIRPSTYLVCIFMPVGTERSEMLQSTRRRNAESRQNRCFVVSRKTLASSRGSKRASACRCSWEIGISPDQTCMTCANG